MAVGTGEQTSSTCTEGGRAGGTALKKAAIPIRDLFQTIAVVAIPELRYPSSTG